MSIFSKIKGAKKAANKHKQELAKHNPTEIKDAPVPYKHIPTHAAVDALSGAPSSWREEDRSAIKAQHKRRSMMPRNDSGMSTIQRNSSYNNSTYSSSSTYHGSDVGLAPAMTMRLESRRSYIANPIHQPSPLATKRVSPAASEANSTSSSSSQFVEMPYSGIRADSNIFDSLHKSDGRKVGEAPIFSQPPPTQVKEELGTVVPPVAVKKRGWGFGKHKAALPAIAAH